jgi:hypothetical protein
MFDLNLNGLAWAEVKQYIWGKKYCRRLEFFPETDK